MLVWVCDLRGWLTHRLTVGEAQFKLSPARPPPSQTLSSRTNQLDPMETAAKKPAAKKATKPKKTGGQEAGGQEEEEEEEEEERFGGGRQSPNPNPCHF